MKLVSKMKLTYSKLFCGLATAMMFPSAVFAASSGDVDVSAPLDLLKKAREKAAASNLSTDGVSSGLSQGAGVVVIACGLIGLCLTGVSVYKLYQSSQDEQSRESVGRSIAGIIIGALLTIIAIIVGFVTTQATA